LKSERGRLGCRVAEQGRIRNGAANWTDRPTGERLISFSRPRRARFYFSSSALEEVSALIVQRLFLLEFVPSAAAAGQEERNSSCYAFVTVNGAELSAAAIE
jgi:hypothetical protein